MSWRQRALKGVAGLVAGLALLTLATVGGAWYALNNPWVLCRGAEWALEWPAGSIDVDTIGIDGALGFEVRGLRVIPPNENTPMVAIGFASGTLPSPIEMVRYQLIDLGQLRADDVVIEQRKRRLPSERPPPPAKAMTLVASSVTIEDGWYVAYPDPPFNAVAVRQVDGELLGVRWTPALRSIEGVGLARAEEMKLGNIEISDLVVPRLVFADGDMQLTSASFNYGRTPGVADGVIRHLDGRPAVEIDVRLEGSRIETAVEDAVSRASPVMGWLEAELTIFAGGELARGDSRFDGWVRMTDAYVFVGNDLKLIPKLLLDVAPWFQREGGGWLAVGDLYGEARFGRGWVELERMERMSKRHRILQAWGELRDGRVDLTVRAVPKKTDKGGVGVRVRGPLQDANIRLAKKGDLLDAPEVIVVD